MKFFSSFLSKSMLYAQAAIEIKLKNNFQKEIHMKKLKKYFALKKALCCTLGGLALASSAAFALSPLPFPVWAVQDGKLVDPNGKPFIFRGVTIDHTLAPEKTLQALKDAAALGANSAQIEIPIKADGFFPRKIVAEVQAIIETCKDNKLVCVLEANDAAGYHDVAGSESPAVMASYWMWEDIYEVLRNSTGHVIIALNNNPLASAMPTSEYVARMQNAIADLRRMYPYHMVMVDGSRWSQDTDRALHQLASANPQSGDLFKNIIYSVDMFDAYVNPETVRDYIENFSLLNAPLVIGGFAPTSYYHPHFIGGRPQSAPRLPVETIMQYAEQYGVGYFGWSWSGNTNPALDIVKDWDKENLTVWGDILFNDPNGIRATAEIASIFQTNSSSSSSSSSVANRPPVADFFASNYPSFFCGSPNVGEGRITAEAKGSYDPDGDPLVYVWKLSGSYSGTGYEFTSRSRSGQSYSLELTVSDDKGASASITKSVGPFYIDCFGSSVPSSSSSSSQRPSSSSVKTVSSSSTYTTMSSSSMRTASSSSIPHGAKALCSYQIQSQWKNGFTASVRIKNVTTEAINGWDANWQYTDGSKITNSWNAALSGSGPYHARNLGWNARIQPGQTVEFGFQGSKPDGAASTPVVMGSLCR
jgi:mannan endo-1,4-beta-mannosidase